MPTTSALRSRIAGVSGRLVLGPIELPEGQVTLRSPRLGDARAWSEARLANRKWLERAFPAWGDEWDAEQQPVDWVQRWWHLRMLFLRGRAKPFVIELDGRLIGELGIDAVDPVSRSGEASVWMVRDHGSASIMNAVSLLLMHYAFNGPQPLRRLTSPVATSSRKGRTPGLSAVGFAIEATVTREVGGQGLVDHDIWVLHNTSAVRDGALRQVTKSPGAATKAARPTATDRRVSAIASAHAIVRGARASVRARRTPDTSWQHPPAPSATVTLRPRTAREAGLPKLREFLRDRRQARRATLVPWSVVQDGLPVGEIRTTVDSGTGVGEIDAWVQLGTDRDVLAQALELTVQALNERVPKLMVRVPSRTVHRLVPDAEMLGAAGLTLVATYAGNPEDDDAWSGEQVWELPSRT